MFIFVVQPVQSSSVKAKDMSRKAKDLGPKVLDFGLQDQG